MFKTMLLVLYSDLNVLQVIYNAITGHDSYINQASQITANTNCILYYKNCPFS